MKPTKRKSATVLIIVLIASLLAGCASRSGDNQGGSPGSGPGGDAGSISGGGSNSPEFVYKSEIIPFPALPDGKTEIILVVLTDNSVYFTAWGDGDAQNALNTHALYSMDVDGRNFTALPNYIPGGLPANELSGEIAIKALHVDNEGNLWVAEYRDLDGSDLPDGLNGSIIRKLDKTGAEISSFDLSSLITSSDSFNVHALTIDNEGNMFIAAGTKIYVLDNRGYLLFELDNPDFLANFVLQSDGAVVFPVQQELSIYLKTIDLERRTWGETISLPTNAANYKSVFSGIGDYLLLYNDSSHLSGIAAEKGELVQVLSWSDLALSSGDINAVMLLTDGRIAAVRLQLGNSAAGGRQAPELVLLSVISRDEIPEKTILTLGTLDYSSETRYAVELFNRNSDTHSIEVIDYAIFDSDDDFSASMLKITTDIFTGNCPDILDMMYMPLLTFVSKDLLVDLYPFIDADPELSRDKLIESLLEASEVDGALYHIIPSFSITTIVGSPSVLGSYPGWNIDEFVAVIEANPQADKPMGIIYSKMFFFSTVIKRNMDMFVDRSSGTASFDSESFIQLLEIANTFPPEIDFDDIDNSFDWVKSGRQIMELDYFFTMTSYPVYRTKFGGELVFKGLPNEDRNGNSFNPSGSYGISKNCVDTDVAWEFLRQFLLDDHQREGIPHWAFPTNKAIFEEFLERTMENLADTKGEEGIQVSDSILLNGEDIELTQEDLNAIRNLVDSTSSLESNENELWVIVRESSSDYFNGLITAQEAARIIQSRVTIYLAEQS